jgi:hypothetical protein
MNPEQPRYASRARRAVVDDAGTVWPSMVAAAKAKNVSISTIWQRATLQRQGYRFADEAPRTPADPSSRRGG